MGPVAHITVITRRADRRVMGRPGERKQLCGGAPTDRDWKLADAKRATQAELERFNVCPGCIDEMRRKG